MSQSAPYPSSFANQMQETIEAAQRSLREGEVFFEQFGLDGNKVRAYLDSIGTPEMHAQAEAAIEEDMRAIEQEARAQLALTTSHATNTRTSPRKPRSMI